MAATRIKRVAIDAVNYENDVADNRTAFDRVKNVATRAQDNATSNVNDEKAVNVHCLWSNIEAILSGCIVCVDIEWTLSFDN